MPDKKLKEIEGWINIGIVIAQIGWPAFLKLFDLIKREDVSIEDFLKLRSRLPIDEPFFEEQP
jgi:hypothetical protein